MWSFALYIDGSWRELNMLDQTGNSKESQMNENVEKEANITET